MPWGVFDVSPSSHPGYGPWRQYVRCFATRESALEWAIEDNVLNPSYYPPRSAPRVIMEPWETAVVDLPSNLRCYAVMPLDPERGT